jgi:gliding motility-associated-like protein
MKRTIRIVFLLITLIGFQLQANGQDLPLACGGSLVRYGVTGLPNSVFNWEIQGGSIKNNYNDSVDILWGMTPGVKTIKVTEYTAFKCINAPSIAQIMISAPSISLGQDMSICEGQTAELKIDSNFVSYLWNTGEITQSINASKTGNYSLRVVDSYGCIARDSLYLTVNQYPKIELGHDTLLCGGFGMILDAGDGGNRYTWSTGEITQTIHIGEGNQTIWVRVENNGCTASDTIRISPCLKSDIPNAFTPNGDGDNDTWRVRYLEGRSNVRVEIFDRWGRRVFYSNNGLPNGGWDGTFNGRNLPMDSYFYIINLNDGSPVMKGNVTIIR